MPALTKARVQSYFRGFDSGRIVQIGDGLGVSKSLEANWFYLTSNKEAGKETIVEFETSETPCWNSDTGETKNATRVLLVKPDGELVHFTPDLHPLYSEWYARLDGCMQFGSWLKKHCPCKPNKPTDLKESYWLQQTPGLEPFRKAFTAWSEANSFKAFLISRGEHFREVVIPASKAESEPDVEFAAFQFKFVQAMVEGDWDYWLLNLKTKFDGEQSIEVVEEEETSKKHVLDEDEWEEFERYKEWKLNSEASAKANQEEVLKALPKRSKRSKTSSSDAGYANRCNDGC